jgi:hypothetical protein
MFSIEATKSSPRIVYEEEAETLDVSGESYPENSFEFFAPLFDWLHEQLPRRQRLVFRVHVRYMNSSSTKCMLDILDLLTERVAEGADISVRWYYDAGNERALDLAEEFKEDLKIPFEILPLGSGEPWT